MNLNLRYLFMSNRNNPGVFLALFATISLAIVQPISAFAQGRGLPIVRDAEIEALVGDYRRPIFKAAGLSKSGVKTVLVNQKQFNAFVAGRRMFINTGALLIAETPNEIIGVIAHEAGHLAGRHQERLREQLRRAQTIAVVSTLLGIGAGVAGAASGSGALAGVGQGIAAGGSEVARRNLFAYQRGEEKSADQSALSYLNKTGQSAHGMIKTFQRFQNALALSGSRVDPYQRSHPVPQERIAALTTLAKQSKYFNRRDSDSLQLRHDMARAKIAAYTDRPGSVARMFKNSQSLPALYGSAITSMLYRSPREALEKIDRLIAKQPDNPYFYEIRGEVLMKANNPSKAAEAYQQAIRFDRAKSGLLKVALGQARLATGKKDQISQAVSDLREGLNREKEYAQGYRFLSQAYGQLGRIGDAELAAAEGHYHSGSYQDAKIFALRAQKKLKRGSPAWIRAQDIINLKTPK